MPHQRLLLKLKAHGNDVMNWIEKWLTLQQTENRVIVDDEISNWKSVLIDVVSSKVLKFVNEKIIQKG